MISFQTYQKIQEHKAYGASMLRTSQIMGLSYNTVSNMEYLYHIFNAEIEMRKAKKKDTLRHESHLPDMTFNHSKITKVLQWQLQRAEQIDFRNTTENFVIVGDCATGKTSLASEIGG